jgi:putative heme-binding domain-containing protein
MSSVLRFVRGLLVAVVVASVLCRGAQTNPVPAEGWTLELIAAAPSIQHPSVVCTAPDGRIFVGEDPMDIRTPKASAREGRILCFHPDGRTTVFATNLFAPFGLRYFEGKLYVLHNPKFTAFEDGGDRATGGFDLLEQTNPDPWALEWNDHIPANFKLAMDGFFYMAVGDKGLYGAVDRSGKRVDLHGGGVVRIRPDGTGLEIVSTGVRNIMDVALTSEDDVFTYDNTDENKWMGRLTHMVDGGFYGYPFDFIPQRPYTLWKLADYGPGAATGTLALTDGAFPDEWADNLILADFGQRNLRRVVLERHAGTFREIRNEMLFTSVPDDFRPVGITESHDGRSLLICDWQFRDTKDTNANVGRLWRLKASFTTNGMPVPVWAQRPASNSTGSTHQENLLTGLNHSSKEVRLIAQHRLARMSNAAVLLQALVSDRSKSDRARAHALWALSGNDATKVATDIVAQQTASGVLKRQALRLLATQGHRHEAIRRALNDSDDSIRFEAATALGLVKDTEAVGDLLKLATTNEPLWIYYAAANALNRIGRSDPGVWKVLVNSLDTNDIGKRNAVSFALRNTYDVRLAAELARFCAGKPSQTDAKVIAVQLLGSISRKAPEWKGEWWAYHPFRLQPPRHSVDWEGTRDIFGALLHLINDNDAQIREAAVDALKDGTTAEIIAALIRQFRSESERRLQVKLIQVISAEGGGEAEGFLLELLRGKDTNTDLLDPVLRSLAAKGGGAIRGEFGKAISVLAGNQSVRENLGESICEALGALKPDGALITLADFTLSEKPKVRSAAVRAIGQFDKNEALPVFYAMARETALEIRLAGIEGLGRIKSPLATSVLMEAWRKPETKKEALNALLVNPDLSAVDAYFAALTDPARPTREGARRALAALGMPALEKIRGAELTSQAVRELRLAFADQPLLLALPLFTNAPKALTVADYEKYALENTGDPWRGQHLFFDPAGVACIRCHRVGEHGGLIGPELTTAGKQFGRPALIEAILYPSKTVREGYQMYIIEMKDGETYAGAIKAESAEIVTLADSAGELHDLPKNRIVSRTAESRSLMPEGLQDALTLGEFADLVAYLESLHLDPTTQSVTQPPSGFEAPWATGNLAEWSEMGGRDAGPLDQFSGTRTNWVWKNGVVDHNGQGGNLWLKRSFGNFELRVEWRWPGEPAFENHPVIGSDGLEAKVSDGAIKTERVLEAGDSGVLLRGFFKAQANLFCYPVGSGEFWEFREEAAGEEKRTYTPRVRADRPLGQWNEMRVRMIGDRVTVWVNGIEVISETRLPGIPKSGPIGFQREHGRLQLRNFFIREL